MTKASRLAFALLSAVYTAGAAEWSEPTHVLHEFKPCVTYRAKVEGDLLIIEAALQPGWHTFAIDNEERAARKRGNAPSIGIDQPTKIELGQPLQQGGPWYQSVPKDFSKPQLRWYSFGFEDRAVFATKVRRTSKAAANLQIRGQACTDKTCKNIDVSVAVPSDDNGARQQQPTVDLKTLVQVPQAE